MKNQSFAAVIDAFGDAGMLKLRGVPRRTPRGSEIEVMITATSVNPIDVRRRNGYGQKLFSLLGAARMPLVLGNDFVGIVTATGSSVSRFREGDAVFGALPPSSVGTHATHVVLRAEHAARQPAGIGASALATLPYNFVTVSRALAGAGLDSSGRIRGREVLVHGASGGLGLIAVRTLASWRARVTAVAGSAGIDACQQAGAATIIDRHRHPLRDMPQRFAATLNFASWDDEAALLRLLANDAVGHATTVHPMLGNFDKLGLLRGVVETMRQKARMRKLVPRGARYAWTVFAPDSRALARLAEHADMYAALTTYKEFSLADAKFAHRHVEQRLPGRAVLLPASS